MDYQNFIGMPLLKVLNELNNDGVSYIIEEQNSIQKKYDTVLVVKVEKLEGKVKLITDKFLLDIGV